MSVNNAIVCDISIIKKSKIKNDMFAVNNSVDGRGSQCVDWCDVAVMK